MNSDRTQEESTAPLSNRDDIDDRAGLPDHLSSSPRPWRDPGLLQKLYHGKELSIPEIAGRFGCANQTVWRWLDTYNIDTRSKSESIQLWHDTNSETTSTDGPSPWRDEETLRRLYVDEGLTQSEVAERLGCAYSTVNDWMARHGIEADSNRYWSPHQPHATFYHHSEPKAAREWWKSDNDYVSVSRLLAVAEYGFDAVAGMHVHHKNKVAWDNRPENIELLTPSDHAQLHGNEGYEGAPWHDEGRLREALKAHSQRELGEMWGVSQPTLMKWRRRFDIAPDDTTEESA